MSSFQPIKSAVIGVGLGGMTFHIPFVLAHPKYFTLHAVLERNPERPGGKLAARFGAEAAKGVAIYRTYEEVLADPQIELIFISTPSETHYALAKQALEAGKHVLVDKPVTATAAEAYELGEIARIKQRVLYPFQNRRWDSDFLTLRKLLDLPSSDPRSLGTLVEFESRFDRFRTTLKNTWKDLPIPANGLTYDLGAHLIDQALVLFGRPTKITAMIENIRGIGHEEVDDCFTIFLHYPRRPASPPGSLQPTSFSCILRGHILSVRSPQVRYVVRGTHGTYIKFGVDVQEDQLKVIRHPAEITSLPTYGLEPKDIWGTVENLAEDDKVIKSPWPSTERGNYSALFVDLAKTIREGKEQAVKWAESAEVIELIELAYRSAKEERTVVVPTRS
ncbi:oxidoreductase [Laetiporus sulphureus 93-53]|uniref:Oxidoreductase n=1 Tax=Laetiporus sulphureus 93-53 TaxID=1314785 RepID=A0A165IBS2_9APHY|nr:oxidoreductase [Laetiporus sulphureus 93-53]KZT12862.1 oxidoreductase [Laetiporus sulphureus 93-53]